MRKYRWYNLHRRDFAKGMALLNEPGGGVVSVDLDMTYYRVDGTAVTSIALGPSGGAILLR